MSEKKSLPMLIGKIIGILVEIAILLIAPLSIQNIIHGDYGYLNILNLIVVANIIMRRKENEIHSGK